MNYLVETYKIGRKKSALTAEGDPAAAFEPVEAYALQPLPLAFKNIEATLLPLLKPCKGVTSFDATAFYSRRKPDITPAAEARLHAVNDAAFAAARSIGGLLVYYQGDRLPPGAPTGLSPGLHELGFEPDCLSFCVWTARRQALAGSAMPAHRAAIAGTGDWYDGFAPLKYAIDTGGIDASQLRDPADISFREVPLRGI